MDNYTLIEKFLNVSKTEKNLSNRTLKAYRCDLAEFAKFFGAKQILILCLDDLRKFLNYLESRSLEDTTIKRKLATLKVFYSFLENEDLINISPTRKLQKKYRIRKRLPRVMSDNEIRRLLANAYNSLRSELNPKDFRYFKRLRDIVILEVLFATGIRIDELVRLTLDDIDLQKGTLIISGKGRKERLLFISNSEVLAILGQYLKYRESVSPETNSLLLNRFCRPLSVHSIGHIFKEYCTNAGIIRHYTPHCIRHTMATMLMENGADVRSVQEILGHSRISTTEIYLSVSTIRRREVLGKFNQRNQFKLNQ